MAKNEPYFDDSKAQGAILHILKSSLSEVINDVTEEGDHIIVTLDLGFGYRLLRVDVSDLGPDTLDHE